MGWGPEWKQFPFTLKTGAIEAGSANHLELTVGHAGTLWLQLVSLFPPTYKNTPNGNRIDLMEKLAGMHPQFLRFPGGNYLEGNTIERAIPMEKDDRAAGGSARTHAARGATGRRTGWGCWSFWNGART